MQIKSYSKINLALKVNSKTPSGLHEIQSLYCLIDLADKIYLKRLQKGKDKIIFEGPFIKSIKKKNNSVCNLLKELRKLKLIDSYYSIKIIKNIPAFSGLGGGTSNAFFLLKYLLKNKLSNSLLNNLTSLIGSDLKIFFKKQGFLKDLKTIIELKKKQKFYFVLVKPNLKCSTKEIYSKVIKFSKKEDFSKKNIKSRNMFLDYLMRNRNDLQFIVEKKYPLIKKLLKDIKSEQGCCFSRMTGSGSVCYGLFKDQIIAKKALNN
jgi:4-diphosphocytidyl-2-C-methyl-D-erythritol kinase